MDLTRAVGGTDCRGQARATPCPLPMQQIRLSCILHQSVYQRTTVDEAPTDMLPSTCRVGRTAAVSTSIQAELQTTWRELSKRNGWELVSDEPYFLAQAAAEFAAIDADQAHAQRLRVALQRSYSEILYNELTWRNERAATELWNACHRIALRDSRTREIAEDLAQEAILRALEKLTSLNDHKSLLGWVLRILSDVRRRSLQREGRYLLGDDTERPEPRDPVDIAEQVEQQILTAEFDALLKEVLPNWLERTALIRVLIEQQKPGEVAQELGLPPHRLRLAKSRGLKHLREHPAASQRLRVLLGYQGSPSGQEGDHDHDS